MPPDETQDDQQEGQTPQATTPDPRIAQLETQMAQALDTTRAALRTANPDLPDAAFAGDDIAALNTSVQSARSIADHVRQQLETQQPTPPGPRVPSGAGITRQAPTVPDTVRGPNKIAWALKNPGPGSTE